MLCCVIVLARGLGNKVEVGFVVLFVGGVTMTDLRLIVVSIDFGLGCSCKWRAPLGLFGSCNGDLGC